VRQRRSRRRTTTSVYVATLVASCISQLLVLCVQVLNKQYLTLQALIDKVRAEGEETLAAARSEKFAMQESYEKVRLSTVPTANPTW
jgi:hypothetical protein